MLETLHLSVERDAVTRALFFLFCSFLTNILGLPWWAVVKNLPCSAGDVGLILGRELKITHAMGQLRPPNKY